LKVIGGLPPGTPAAFEAAYGTSWLVELLEDSGFTPHLVHASRCKAIASARLKNDKADAAILARAMAMSIRSHALDVAGWRRPRRDKVAAAGRRPPAAVVCPEPVFDGRVGTGDALTGRKAHPSGRGRGANQHADALNAGNRWSACLDGVTRHSAWPMQRMGAHVRSQSSQKLAAETRNQPSDLRRDGRIEPATP
jgi:hypothetical protein